MYILFVTDTDVNGDDGIVGSCFPTQRFALISTKQGDTEMNEDYLHSVELLA